MIGDWIKQQREIRDWTQSELAQRSGISLGYVKQLEINERPNPGGGILRKLATAFEVTVDDVLKGAQDDFSHAPIDLLRVVWPEEEVQSLAAEWSELAQISRQDWWTLARKWYAKRQQIAEARKLLAEVDRRRG